MKKLNDYSGEFLPNLKLNDFSADTLAELLTLFSKLYIALDGYWYLALQERVSNEEALACDIRAWKNACQYEMAKITKQLSIQGNDVVAFMKALQISPWFRNMECKMEIRNKNNALLTVTRCPTLTSLEKEGQGREGEICNMVCSKTYKDYASFFSPDIEVKCLKLPPRKSKDEICCQWEFELGSQAV